MNKNNITLNGKPIHIVAEAGTNHNGDVLLAKKLVQIAKRAGADSVKFQIIFPRELYLPGKYKYGHYDINKIRKWREATMLSEKDYEEISEYCKINNIYFSASVFDQKSLDILMKFDPPYIKIASCDLNNIMFLRKVAEKGKKMIISTGMSTLTDIEKTLKALNKIGFNDITLLHCVSVYPALLEKTNLNFIDTLKNNFGYEVGFSDHTEDSIASCIALAKGATWFEKHFTTNRKLEGPDHPYALEEEGFKKYVDDIHKTTEALQDNSSKISSAEYHTRKRARRSLYASRDVEAGEKIKEEDILIVRPENIMNADDVDLIISKKIKKNIKKYQPFSLDMF